MEYKNRPAVSCLLREVDYREQMFIGLAETLTFDMIPKR